MFNIGPAEFLVLAIVGILVVGPDRIPDLTRDAARLIKSLREMATGARTQLRDELGPEFANLDLRSLNPRTALTQMLLGDDDEPAATKPVSAPMASPDFTKPPTHKPLGRDERAPFDSDAT